MSIRWVETGTGDADSVSPINGGKACLVLASASGSVGRLSPVGEAMGSIRSDGGVVFFVLLFDFPFPETFLLRSVASSLVAAITSSKPSVSQLT